MKPAPLTRGRRAFTILELFVIMAILTIGVTLYLPMVNRGCRMPVQQGACMNNLKQVGIGWWLYAADHADRFPWQLSTNSAITRAEAESRPASEQFLVLTNYVPQTSTFVCPSDKFRTPTPDYSSWGNSNLSYFAALTAAAMPATQTYVRSILAGDRHLSVDAQAVKTGLCTLEKNSVPGWTPELHKSKDQVTRGSLLFVDGHVEFLPHKKLPDAFRGQPITTTRLIIPYSVRRPFKQA